MATSVAVVKREGYVKVIDGVTNTDLLSTQENIDIYERPDWWLSTSSNDWAALSWALGGVGEDLAKMWALENLASSLKKT